MSVRLRLRLTSPAHKYTRSFSFSFSFARIRVCYVPSIQSIRSKVHIHIKCYMGGVNARCCPDSRLQHTACLELHLFQVLSFLRFAVVGSRALPRRLGSPALSTHLHLGSFQRRTAGGLGTLMSRLPVLVKQKFSVLICIPRVGVIVLLVLLNRIRNSLQRFAETNKNIIRNS
ncbi:hypothetical protein DFH06DRAFT_92969 [Mycena polygramma]|nr:hypothetical protein DFH06DRAFT_92969 [Mycena polygramma]